eukprot:2275565-Rhodomonas_salina.2
MAAMLPFMEAMLLSLEERLRCRECWSVSHAWSDAAKSREGALVSAVTVYRICVTVQATHVCDTRAVGVQVTPRGEINEWAMQSAVSPVAEVRREIEEAVSYTHLTLPTICSV